MSSETERMKYAFYGRVSTEDAQDPSLSIPRQLATCERIIHPLGGEILGLYWDIESGRKNLADRGSGAAGELFGIELRRDGGLPELLAAAANGAAFDAVIVESIDRLSRMTADATRIERDLEAHDIALFASDEPMTANATAILTRRVKQGVAEWYVRDLIEKSRRGMEESVRQGWHTGGPAPYGYLLEPHPHPNPNKARDGMKKHRLVPDPVRAPIVRMIFEDYCVNGFGLGAICDKLNNDLDRYPPPTRNKKDENDLPQTWSRSQLHSLLRNPKYTGYNVWGRHDKRPGRPFIRPRTQWVWSPTPSHEALISRELLDAVDEQASRNNNPLKNVAPLRYPARPQPRKGRTYAFRGRVRCGFCGLRMEGSHKKGANWYRCRFVSQRGYAAADAAGHPRALGIKEEAIREAAFDFLGRRLFGPDRLSLLRDELAREGAHADGDHDRELAQLNDEREELGRALYRQALRLEEHDDPTHPVISLATRRIEELSTRRDAVAARIKELEQTTAPTAPKPEAIENLLAAIPDLRPLMQKATPEDLRELLSAFDFGVIYDKELRVLRLSAVLTDNLVQQVEKQHHQRKPVGDIFHSGGRI
jgi:site-specific DNA recombinase